MTVWLIAYSDRGCHTALRAAAALTARGNACRVFASEKHRVSEAVEALTVPCADWAGKGFAEADHIIEYDLELPGAEASDGEGNACKPGIIPPGGAGCRG